jgi:hypothetical protein
MKALILFRFHLQILAILPVIRAVDCIIPGDLKAR